MNFIKKLFYWYFSKRAMPYWGIVFIDSFIIAISSLFIYAFDFNLNKTSDMSEVLSLWVLAYIGCYWVGFRLFHTYSGIIRYSTFIDLQRIASANTVGFVLSVIITRLGRNYFDEGFRYVDLFFSFLMITFLMWTVRLVVKHIFDLSTLTLKTKGVFIFGTRQGGVSLAKSILNNNKSRYRLKGFVSEDQKYIGHHLLGVSVFANDEKLLNEMLTRHVQVLLISPLQTDNIRKDHALVDRLIANDIKIMILPHTVEWDGKSDLNYHAFKDVEVEDLLPRDKIEIDMEKVGELLTGKKILITGAAGSIGSEMVKQISIYNPEQLILIDQAETPLHDIRLYMKIYYPQLNTHTIVANICNQSRMEKIFSEYRPDYVFHAAAYKHVPMMEDNPSESVQNNVFGTRVIADLAVKYDTKKFVMVSTDKAVNPTNVMGCSKRICEIYVQSLNKAIKEGKVKGVTRFVTTRFGNVLGSNGSVIPLFRKQLKAGGPLTVTHPDIIRYFMLIPEACKLVLQAGTMGQGGEIYIFDMGEPVRIADLAKRMIQLSGLQNIEIKYTGLRDGEKLYEELLNDKETTKPSSHPKIKIAKVREYEYEEAKRNEDRLYQASFAYDDMETVRIMKEIVPEFKSQHSKYEVLDK